MDVLAVTDFSDSIEEGGLSEKGPVVSQRCVPYLPIDLFSITQTMAFVLVVVRMKFIGSYLRNND